MTVRREASAGESSSDDLATPSESAPRDRRAELVCRVKEILGDLSGLDPDAMDEHASFLELGFESLSLTQASMAIKKEFSVELSFRQLLEELCTPVLLAHHLHEALPAEAVPAASNHHPDESLVAARGTPTVASLFPASQVSATVPFESFEEMIAEQLRVISRQLDMLQSGGMKSRSERAGHPELTTAQRPSTATTSGAGALESKPTTKGPWRPIDESDADGLDVRQRQHLDDLIARLCARTRESKRWTQRNRDHLADPRTVAGFRRIWKELVYPVVVTRSSGSRVWDLDGNEYIDLAMGFGVNLLGHSPSFITDAVREQLDRGVEIGPQTPLAGEVARLITDFTGHERVAFSNTGSEAVLAAIRMARTVTGRTKIVTFDGDYHGIFDEVLARPVSTRGSLKSVPVAPGIPPHMVQSIVAVTYGDPSSLGLIEEMAEDVALVLVEPVQSRHPDLQPRDFLQALRETTERLGIPLVFDEMITGFRCHPGGAQALFDVRADISTYGKVVGGGFPIGVVAGQAKYMDALDGGTWAFGDDSFPEVGVTWFAGTFVRHPVALTAARATLRHLAEQGAGLQERLNARTTEFVTELNEYYRQIGAPIWLEHFSSFFLITFQKDREWSSLFYYHLRDQGVHITEGRAAFLSTAHTDADLDHLLEAFKSSARALQDGGFLSGGMASVEPTDPSTGTERRLVPVTEAQEEIWLAATAGRGAECAFNLSNRLELEGELDAEALEAALDQLVRRHEALRATFIEDGRLMTVAGSGAMLLNRVDLSSVEERSQKLKELAQYEVETPFDLVAGPLSRSVLIQLASDHHVLFLTVHHIICDGWSCGVLLRDLGELYAAERENRAPNLDPPMQITDYALLQERQQSSRQSLENEKYWVEQFSDAVPKLEFPTDSARPALKTYDAAREELTLPEDLVAEVTRVASSHGCTLFMVLLSAFEVFLSRLVQQSDFVIGVSAAGQLAAGGPNLVGHCVSLLPMRTRINPGDTFEQHLLATRERVLDSFERQDFTFGTLLKKLHVPRDPSRLPLVDVVFNMDSAMAGLSYPGLIVEGGSNPRAFENFELFFNVVSTDPGLRIECTYNTDLFRAETIRRRLEEFVVLLTGAAAKPDTELTALPLLTKEERETLLHVWNETQLDFPEDTSLADLFEAQARRSPDAEAIVFGGDCQTYRQLNEAANRIAHYLRAHGVGPEALVGVCLSRGPHLLAAILGVLKAGGGYVPLDPEYPLQRLRFMLEDCAAQVVITEAGWLDRLPGQNRTVLCLDDDQGALDNQPADDPERTSQGSDVAYVIYTSGSTGRPKGVVIENRNAVALLHWAYTVFEPGALSGVLFATSVCFDLSVFEIMLPLTRGGRVVLAQDILELPDLPAASEVTLVNTVPSAMSELVGGSRIPASVGTICLAGEPLSPSLVDQIYQHTSVERVFDLYGPSEDTTYSTWTLREEGGRNTIGHPIANTRAYVLDLHGNPLPIGVPGELHLGGAGVARGYLNRAELTKERFLPDPYAGDEGARMYRTGDMVRYLPDGQLVFLGRRDDQVKLRGYRIELGEIEAALQEHSGVNKAIILMSESAQGDRKLIGYVVGDDGSRVDVAEITRFLLGRLPAYMVPSVIMALDDFPRLPNGKLDRSRLPEPTPESGSRGGVAPAETPLEAAIKKLWEEVLGVTVIGAEDDFFDLGGNSLQAVRVLNRLEQRLGVHMSPATIFEHPTVRRLAEHMSEHHPDVGRELTSAAHEDETDPDREEVTL